MEARSFLTAALCIAWASTAWGQFNATQHKRNRTSSNSLDSIMSGAVNSQTVPTQLPVFRADLSQPGQSGQYPDAFVLLTMKTAELVTYRVLVGSSWTAGWNPGNVLALFANPDITGNVSMVAVLCGPLPGAATCAGGQPGSDLVWGNITRASILGSSALDYDTTTALLSGYLVPWNQTNDTVGDPNSIADSSLADQETRVPGLLVYALGPPAPGTNDSATLLSGAVVPANAAALPVDQVPFAEGDRFTNAIPFHAFLWPLPSTDSTAAGAIALTLYNDSSLSYTIMLHDLAANDSITSCAMESLDPALVHSADGYDAGAFAWPAPGCCGGDAPNFFSSNPLGVQAPLDGSDFMLVSAEWPPPDTTTKRGRFVAGMLFDMQQDNFLVGVRLRTQQAPDGLLLGVVVLGCGPDGLHLPVTDSCADTISGNRRRR